MLGLRRLAILAGIAGVLCASVLSTPVSAGPDSASRPSASTWVSDWFRSPTGNIRCRYFYGANPLVACLTLNDGAMAGVRLCCGTGFKKLRTSRGFPSGPVLRYGQVWRTPGEFKCKSTVNGMECWSLVSGHGFFINRDQWLTY